MNAGKPRQPERVWRGFLFGLVAREEALSGSIMSDSGKPPKSSDRPGDDSVVWSRADFVVVLAAAVLGIAAGELLGWAILPLARALLLGNGTPLSL